METEDEKTPSVSSDNPYRRPIIKFVGDIKGIEWQLPYLPQFIQAAVLVLVILITSCLYATVGVASQIASIFQSLLVDAKKQMSQGGPIEKSAYAVAAGIYFLLWLPLFLLLLPFLIIGWLWNHFGYWCFAAFIAVSVAVAVVLFVPRVRQSVFDTVQSGIEHLNSKDSGSHPADENRRPAGGSPP